MNERQLCYHDHVQGLNVHGYLCLDIPDSHILHSRGFFFSQSSSFCCTPHEILSVICGALGGFVDLPGISLSLYTIRP